MRRGVSARRAAALWGTCGTAGGGRRRGPCPGRLRRWRPCGAAVPGVPRAEQRWEHRTRVPAAAAAVEGRGETMEQPSGCCGCSRVEGERGQARPGKSPGDGDGARGGGSGTGGGGSAGARGERRLSRRRGGAAGLGPGLAACTAGPPGRAFPGKQNREFLPARPRAKGQRSRGGSWRGSVAAQGRWGWRQSLCVSFINTNVQSRE